MAWITFSMMQRLLVGGGFLFVGLITAVPALAQSESRDDLSDRQRRLQEVQAQKSEAARLNAARFDIPLDEIVGLDIDDYILSEFEEEYGVIAEDPILDANGAGFSDHVGRRGWRKAR